VLVSLKNIFCRGAVTAALCATAWGQGAQTPAQQGGQTQGAPAPAQQGPQWKDRAEYDLVQSIQKETDATKQLALLNEWKQKYPSTDFTKVRLGLFLQAYQKLNQIDNLISTANDLVAADPKDVQTLSALLVLAFQLNNTSPAMLDFVDKTSQSLIDNIDNKPANVTDAQWKTQKDQTLALAHRGMGWAALQRKNNAAVKEHLTKSLELNGAQADVSYWLGQAIIGEKDETTYPVGLYHVARAATYEGQGALPPANRQQVNDYLTKAYSGFHGDASGLDEVKQTAKTNALPPPDFKILSVKEVAEAKLKAEQAFAAENPKLALWRRIREALEGPDGQQYFESSVKEAEIPELRGWLVEQRPKELLIAVSDKTTPEITLVLDSSMPGKAEPGTELTFDKAIGKAFTKEPFMVTMEAERQNIKGWPAPPAKKPARSKRAR
jgi:hypothetical protein